MKERSNTRLYSLGMIAFGLGLSLTPLVPAPALAQDDAALETGSSLAQRPDKPDFMAISAALDGQFSLYKTCVDETISEAIGAMWERAAPVAAALYDVSGAYRRCEGFAEFWPTLYFAGFDSPEQWVDIELRAIKTAAMVRAETDVATMRDSRNRLRQAWLNIPNDRVLKADEKDQARKALSAMIYVLDTLRPNEGDAEHLKPLVEAKREALLAHLPEGSEERLKEALEFSAADGKSDERVLRRVKNKLR
ncbi:MAG: hypothetical protein MRY63_06470 [Neomegalonema sp.]|nr:hypothetical protein [Neomegalonema sp.]